MGKKRGTNHHGRGKGGKAYSPKHIDRHDLKEAKHIDQTKTPKNRYWLCNGTWKQPGDCEAAERAYYRKAFSAGQEAQNARYRKKGNYDRQRTVDQVYDVTTTSPEGSLLYIGCLKDGLVDPDDLWACAQEYREWENETLGENYVVLTMGMHVDEKGQYHVEERGVYQYRDNEGNLRPGQNAALEAAGIPLPNANQPRNRENNRKMTWDAARREKWLDILEAHGYDIERTPEDARPHMGLEAWQAWQDSKKELDAQANQQKQVQIFQAKKAQDLIKQQNDLTVEAGKIKKRETDVAARETAVEGRETLVKAREDALTTLATQAALKALQDEIRKANEARRRPDSNAAARAAISETQKAMETYRGIQGKPRPGQPDFSK